MKKTFSITIHGKTLKVVVLPNLAAVQQEWEKMYGASRAKIDDCVLQAFFADPPNRFSEVQVGTIFLPCRHSRIVDFSIHESTHAAFSMVRNLATMEPKIDHTAEEMVATLAGTIASRVIAQLNKYHLIRR